MGSSAISFSSAMRLEINIRRTRADRDRKFDFKYYPEFNGEYLHNEYRRMCPEWSPVCRLRENVTPGSDLGNLCFACKNLKPPAGSRKNV